MPAGAPKALAILLTLNAIALTAGAVPARAESEPRPGPDAAASALSARLTPTATSPGAPATSRLAPAVFQSTMVASLDSTARASRYLGRYLSGVVIDRHSGRTLWSTNSSLARLPASTQKVVTAYTVLRSMPADRQFVTSVVLEKQGSRTVFLRGAGDPSLSRNRVRLLAVETARRLKSLGQTSTRVLVDDRALPPASMAPGWKRSYLTGDVQHVRGLTLAGYRGGDGALAAGKVFAGYLSGLGLSTRFVGRSATPARGVPLASSWSPTVGSLVATMLSVSDNDYAEYLLRHAAIRAGRPGTFAGATAHQRAVLAAGGVPLRGFLAWDGSGLSRSNRMPVATLGAVLRRLLDTPAYRDIVFSYGAIPRAGQTGTLRRRFTTSYQACAKGRVLAKTGTLSGVVGLAGLARGADGRDRIVVLLDNGRGETNAVRSSLDTMATIAVGCRLG